jgi:D-alanine--D-alanine ligase
MANIEQKIKKDAKIAVLCGGMSSEAEVSRRSGKGCFEALQRLGYTNSELVEVDKNIAQKLQDGNFDYAYNALHGKFGEDGCIQGILEILNIPYTGCGVMSSAVCMNKEYTKRILSTNPNIPLAKSAFVQKGDDLKEKTKDLKYPVFTKPVSEGSSFGMTKVDTPEELEEAYNQAIKYNDDVLIEEFIKGAFVTVGVLEDNGKNFATEILEIRPKNEWYDFESKYTPGMSEFVLPAKLSNELTQKVKNLAVLAHETAGCRGVSRVDFMISEDGIPYVIEINTSPGMTATSDLPAQSKVMGITYDNLVQLILNGAGLNK